MADDLEGGFSSEVDREGSRKLQDDRDKALAAKRRWAQKLAQLVNHDIWPFLEEHILAEVAEARTRYDQAKTMDEVADIRGEIKGLQRLLQLRKKVQSSL